MIQTSSCTAWLSEIHCSLTYASHISIFGTFVNRFCHLSHITNNYFDVYTVLRHDLCYKLAVSFLGFLDPNDIADFLKECLKMKAFVHPHVMGILGICLAGQVPYIVMPFMANGNLHTYLRKHRMELLITKDEDTDLV